MAEGGALTCPCRTSGRSIVAAKADRLKAGGLNLMMTINTSRIQGERL